MELNENRNLGGVWREESFLSNREEVPEEQPKREKIIFFLGERKVEPQNTVIFENGTFFVERTAECLIVRPKIAKEYLKLVRGRRMVKFERKAKDILLPTVAEDSEQWFKEKYVESSKGNHQGRFIREIWKYKNEVFSEVVLG